MGLVTPSGKGYFWRRVNGRRETGIPILKRGALLGGLLFLLDRNAAGKGLGS